MNFDTTSYIWTENPKIVFVIEWTGDNWDEMVLFLRRHTRGWEVSVYSTYEKTVMIDGLASGVPLILEPWDHLLVEAGGKTGKVVGEVDLLMGYREGRRNS